MQSAPHDLTDDAVAGAVFEGWGRPRGSAEYAPVGYGSHHWIVTDGGGARWFTSVDTLPATGPAQAFDRLAAALELAVTARQAGRSFVVAPVRTPAGSLLQRMGGHHALALYPFVVGHSGTFGDELSATQGVELTRLLCSLHDVPGVVSMPAGGGMTTDMFEVAGQAALASMLGELHAVERWKGPYGQRLRRLLSLHEGDIQQGFRRHDRLVRAAGPQEGRLVLTHGEPHPGNLLHTPQGLKLIGWDTALFAPPERDLWLVDVRTGGQASTAYMAESGRALRPELLARYELAWALADVVNFLKRLRHATEESADTSWSWRALQDTCIDLTTLASRSP